MKNFCFKKSHRVFSSERMKISYRTSENICKPTLDNGPYPKLSKLPKYLIVKWAKDMKDISPKRTYRWQIST